MLPKTHALVGALALLLTLSFWSATIITLLTGDKYVIYLTKRTIAWALLALVPMLIAAGLSGRQLAMKMRGPLIARKQARMRRIAIMGAGVLLPAALVLVPLAAQGQGGPLYWTIQTAELVAGAHNIALLSANMRDGLRLRRQRSHALA